MAGTGTGLDRVLRDGLSLPGKGRAAVLCNATTVSRSWIPTAEALARVPGVRLERIFAPQHGFAAEKQDNMRASGDGAHPRLGIPIHSLYGERREPLEEDFDGLDALIVDIFDIGTRVYTFLVSAILAARVAARKNLPVVVLDRPNPLGGTMEGPVLREPFQSFVGTTDIPLRHGLTVAEGCLYAALREGRAAGSPHPWRYGSGGASRASMGLVAGGLHIVPLEDWSRARFFDETELPWTPPSPNMPALDTAIVYPGQVLLEGTNLSEGRGTTRPFEIFGAPYLDPAAIANHLRERGWIAQEDSTTLRGAAQGPLAGALLREVAYEPTFNRYAEETSRGFQMHVLDREAFRPVSATVALLDAIRRTHAAFAWREPPYEYEWTRMPIDLICGTDTVRQGLDAGVKAEDLMASWEPGLAAFRERARAAMIYGA